MLTIIRLRHRNHGRTRLLPTLGLVLLATWLFPAASLPAQNRPISMDDFFRNWMRMSPEQRAELRKVDVPWQIERDQGRQTFEAYRRHLQQTGVTVSDSSRDAQYLKELVARVHPLMENSRRYRQIEVHVADGPDVDARSIPGGYLVFHRGLLEFAESEAALVGIIGHELSHLDHKHQLKPVQQWIRTSNQLSRANRMNLGDFFSLGQNMMNSFHPFHPEEEEEADLDGVQWMHQLGYDARELARLFQRLGERPRRGDPAVMPAFLRTHPLFPDRAATTLRHYQLMQRRMPRDELVVGREALAEREPAELPEARRGRRRR
jgi:predicted Zn-dependent protease